MFARGIFTGIDILAQPREELSERTCITPLEAVWDFAYAEVPPPQLVVPNWMVKFLIACKTILYKC